jgi:hypothetical protein
MRLLLYPFLITLFPIIIGLCLKYIKTKLFQKFPKLIIILTVGVIGIICMFSAVILCANSIDSKCATGAVIFFPLGIGTTALGILLNVKSNLFKL